jgi:imidazolonepropionase-like amidohydrolase
VREDGVLDDIPTFTLDELRAIVDEAHRERHKVASHAMALSGVHNSVEAGVDSIEHGNYIADEDLKTMAARGIFYVPTIFVGEYVAQGRAAEGAPVWVKMIQIHEETFRRAMKAGVKIAFGTDAGGFDWKVNPAKEFSSMVKFGMTPAQAIRSATSVAAELLGEKDSLGRGGGTAPLAWREAASRANAWGSDSLSGFTATTGEKLLPSRSKLDLARFLHRR